VHDLRHCFAIRAIRNGMTLYELSQVLGHKNAATVTARYADITPERVDKLISDIPAVELPVAVPEPGPTKEVRHRGTVIPIRPSGG